MHLSKASASLAISVAILAGCATSSQGTSSLPNSSSASPSLTQLSTDLAKGRIDPMKRLKLQAEGKLPGPIPRAESQRILKYLSTHPRPQIKVDHRGGPVVVWTTNAEYSFLLGLNAKYAAVKAIDTENNGCDDPLTIKVDAERNAWVACEDATSSDGALEQEYPAGNGTPVTYGWTPGTSTGCPASQTCYGSQYDGGTDMHGDVFAEISSQFYCNPSGCFDAPAGFVFWKAGDPPSTAQYILAPSWVTNVEFMDTDTKGNIWFDYESCSGSTSCAFGLAEVQKATRKHPKFVPILPPGELEYPGGVYVSHHGKILNITDQDTGSTYQVKLPVTPSSEPINTLGPTVHNIFGYGDPISGGFNETETNLAIGDGDGWLDVGTVKTNKWKAKLSTAFPPWLDGAAYTPSDK